MILLECPKCGRIDNAKRHETDPPAAVRVQIACGDCNPSDFEVVRYFDASGQEVFQE